MPLLRDNATLIIERNLFLAAEVRYCRPEFLNGTRVRFPLAYRLKDHFVAHSEVLHYALKCKHFMFIKCCIQCAQQGSHCA